MGLIDVLRQEFSFITGNYRILVVSWMIMDLAMEMPNPNFQYYIRDVLGGPPMALGMIGLANFLAMAAVAFPGGYLADKYGRRWLITTMTFAMALSFLFFAFAPTWHFILLGTIVSSLCLIYQPALFAMVQDSLPPERRGMGSSIIQLIHGTFNTPGPIIAGFLLWQFGMEWSMRTIYLLMTALYLTAAVWRLRLKETITNREPIRFSECASLPKKQMISLSGAVASIATILALYTALQPRLFDITIMLIFVELFSWIIFTVTLFIIYGAVFSQKAIVLIRVISSYPKAIKESWSVWKVVPRSMFWLFTVRTLAMFGMSLTNVINALYARDVLGIPEEQWWLVFIPLLLTMVVASIPIGKMVDKIGRKIPLILGLFILGVATLIFVTGNLLTIMISMVLFGIAQMLVMSAAMALSTDLVHQVNRGKVQGFINFIGYIVMAFGMLLGNYFYVSFIPQLPFYTTLGLIVPQLLIILFLVHEPEKRVGMVES